MLDHLSYSSVSSYLTCARAWRFHYIDGIKTPTSTALVFGKAFHDAIETIIAQPNTEPVEAWGKAWHAETEGANIEWGSDTPESLSNQAIRMLTQPDALSILRAIKPQAIEKRVELRVPGVPIPVIGFIDLLTDDGPADFKTSAQSWTADKAANEMQPVFYLAALNQAGHPLKDLTFTHYVFVKTKTPQVQVLKATRYFSEMFWMFGMIADVWRGIAAEVYPPNPSTWKCSPRYCEYWGMCRGK